MRAVSGLIIILAALIGGVSEIRADPAPSELPGTHVELRILAVGGMKEGVGWAMLESHIFAPENAGDLELGVRDARGGMMVVRDAPGNAAERKRLSALPLVNAGDLPDAQWPVEVVLQRPDGTEIWHQYMNVSLTGAQHVLEENQDLTGAGAWIFPGDAALRRPWVIEPRLANVIELQQDARPGRATATALLLTGPGAIVALLLVRGLFRRARVVIFAAVLAMVGIAGAVIALVSSASEDRRYEVGWTTTPVGAQRAVTIRESLVARTSLFGAAVSVEGQPGEMLMPVAESVHEYWSMRDVVLKLNDAGAMRLEGTVPARQRVAYETRSVVDAVSLPGFPATASDRVALAQAAHLDLAHSWWVVGGYCYSGTGGLDEQGQVFAAWAGQQSVPLRSTAQAWYELRFDVHHRYLLQWDGGESGTLCVLDWSGSQ